MSTRELLTERLEQIHDWYGGMVDERTGMLGYMYVPDRDAFAPERSPIRDIASAWDAAVLERFLGRDQLREVIDRSVAHFAGYLIERDGALVLDPLRLGEPSTIAHSAFLLLAMLRAPTPRWRREIAALAEGIVRQQRPDGSYAVFFSELPDSGEELYGGEATLALLAGYFQRGRVADDLLVFFGNWQAQACRLLVEHARTPALAREVADYLHRIFDRVITQGLFDSGVGYLLAMQCMDPGTGRGYGGFGFTHDDRRQRIDVTGHVASAFMKIVDSGVDC